MDVMNAEQTIVRPVQLLGTVSWFSFFFECLLLNYFRMLFAFTVGDLPGYWKKNRWFWEEKLLG